MAGVAVGRLPPPRTLQTPARLLAGLRETESQHFRAGSDFKLV